MVRQGLDRDIQRMAQKGPQWAGESRQLKKVISELSLKGQIQTNQEDMPSNGNSLHKETQVRDCDLNSVLLKCTVLLTKH